ncbi:hypothetical protein KGQ19_49025, partial [Catenulispora sp. NL8]|nr:hypothetical protein [Catenulispora pinistramenti]
PAQGRLTSPYDLDTRWAAKGDDLFWNGYKVHISEACDAAPSTQPGRAGGDLPHIVTNIMTTDAAVPDAVVVNQVHEVLDGRGLA